MLNLLIYIFIAMIAFFLTGCAPIPVVSTVEGTTTIAVPHLLDIFPGSGSSTVSEQVDINGTALTNVIDVQFGGVSGTGLNIIDDNLLQVNTPVPHAPGAVNVVAFTHTSPSDNSLTFHYE